MDWFDGAGEYHERTFAHDGRLSSLPEEWQREMAALWRLEADINHGGYLQFLENSGKESYIYAVQGLKKIGAHAMATIVDQCQALVEEHVDLQDENARDLSAKRRILPDGSTVEPGESLLPESVIDRVLQMS